MKSKRTYPDRPNWKLLAVSRGVNSLNGYEHDSLDDEKKGNDGTIARAEKGGDKKGGAQGKGNWRTRSCET